MLLSRMGRPISGVGQREGSKEAAARENQFLGLFLRYVHQCGAERSEHSMLGEYSSRSAKDFHGLNKQLGHSA